MSTAATPTKRPGAAKVMRQYELVDRVRSYNPDADEELLNRAYVYAMKAHGSQKRASGDPYISHPLEVAAILTDLKLDDATIVAAVLHDTIEDTESTREEIDTLFGSDIGALVEGLTKIKRLDLVSKRARQAENFRKLLLAVADDVRVLLVKLADRLHNMRTLGFMPVEKRRRIAEETLDIYAPLAGRMGMQGMRSEFEDLAFMQLMPDAHAAIVERLSEMRVSSSSLIHTIENELAGRLRVSRIDAEVRGREKQPYSIWRKMEQKQLALEQLSDIYGFRVIVEGVQDCYLALGLIHTQWPNVPGRFKDYISTPKQNDYRSLHTTVVGPGRQRVELQVRTREMDEVAEFGIAGHALYKDGRALDLQHLAGESRAYHWLRRTIGLLAEGDSSEEFLEHTKLELFHDQVFCFTPKGRLIALPAGATAIDFAYAIHTGIGNTAVGAKIDGRPTPLASPLKNGDEVEVICAAGSVPPVAWEHVVATGKARAAIRRATRAAVRAQYSGLGRRIVVRAFERAGRAISDDKLRSILPRLAQTSLEDTFAAVGRGEMFSGDLVKAVYPDFKDERRPAPADTVADGWFGLEKVEGLRFRVPGSGSEAIPIRGLGDDLPVRFAPGGAVPGDRIVGIVTPGEGITIYPIQSPALSEFEDNDRWLDVRWDVDGERGDRFPARIEIEAINEPGCLASITSVIAELGGNIDDIDITTRSQDVRAMNVDVGVVNLKQLTAIIARLRQQPVVSRAERLNG